MCAVIQHRSMLAPSAHSPTNGEPEAGIPEVAIEGQSGDPRLHRGVEVFTVHLHDGVHLAQVHTHTTLEGERRGRSSTPEAVM